MIKLGLGGALGSGRQWWSWITLDDEIAAIEHLIHHEVSGPVNLCSPSPARNRDVVKALGQAFGRPTLLPAPAFALRTALGEFSSEVLSSIRMVPRVLQDTGFGFRHPDLDGAVAWLASAG
jgi:NAD dependent epimerase/dehydratase family enzyme